MFFETFGPHFPLPADSSDVQFSDAIPAMALISPIATFIVAILWWPFFGKRSHLPWRIRIPVLASRILRQRPAKRE